MNNDKWPTFFVDTNFAWGKVENKQQWEEIITNISYSSLGYNRSEALKYLFNTYKSKDNGSYPWFSYYNEHNLDYNKNLKDFFIENNLPID